MLPVTTSIVLEVLVYSWTGMVQAEHDSGSSGLEKLPRLATIATFIIVITRLVAY